MNTPLKMRVAALKIRALARRATPGPWAQQRGSAANLVYGNDPGGPSGGFVADAGNVARHGQRVKADAAHIAAWSPDLAEKVAAVLEGYADWMSRPNERVAKGLPRAMADLVHAIEHLGEPGMPEPTAPAPPAKAPAAGPLSDLPDPRRVAEFRRDGGGFPSERWVHSVTIGSDVWINGVRFPWYVHEDGVRVEWGEPSGRDEVRIGRLVLELMVSDDDTIITDLRPEATS